MSCPCENNTSSTPNVPCTPTQSCVEVVSTECVMYTGTEKKCGSTTVYSNGDSLGTIHSNIVDYICEATSGTGTLTIYPVTYSQFYNLITSNSLVPTAKYKILDYRSTNFLNGLRLANNPPDDKPEYDYYPQEVYYGEIEPIIVTASSTYEIEPIAYSDVYKDDIIHYVPYTNKIAVNIELYNGDVYGTTGLNLQWDGTHVYFDMPANHPILYGHKLFIDLYNPVLNNSLGISFINIKIGTSIPNRIFYYSSGNGADLTQSINCDITITNNNTRVIFENLTYVDFLNLEGNVHIYHVQEISNSYGFISRREDTLNRVSVPFDYRGYKYRRYEMNITSIFPSFYDNNYIGTAPEVMFTDPITGNQTLITTTGNYYDYSVFSSVIDLQWNGVGTPDYYTFGTPSEYLVSRADNNVFNCTLGDCIIDNCEVIENTITPQPINAGFYNESVFKGNKIHFSFIQNIISGEFENNIINTKEGNTFNTENFAQNIIWGRVTGNNLSGRITLNHIVELKICNLEYYENNKIIYCDGVNGKAISYNEGDALRRVYINSYFYNNTFLEITDTIINGDCYGNNVKNIVYCKIGWFFQNNTIANGFNNNTIGDNFSDNTIGLNFRNNHIGDYFGFNYIFESYYGPMPNTIGDNFAENHIKNNFCGNEIGDDFNKNNIGNLFCFNTIGINFKNNVTGNYFGTDDTVSSWPNNIGDDFNDNNIGNYCYNNTIGNNCRNNFIRDNFAVNNIDVDFARNFIGDAFNENIIAFEFTDNKIAGSFSLNTTFESFFGNEIGEEANNNNFYQSSSNKIGEGFAYNIIGTLFNNNQINNYFKNNTIGNNFESNVIGDYFQENSIGEYFTNNQIGNYFGYDGYTTGNGNVIVDNSTDNVIGNYFYANTFTSNFNNNITLSTFSNNTLGNFYNNKVSDYFDGNSFGDSCNNNDFKAPIIQITAGINFKHNTITNTFTGHIILDNFQQNLIETQIPPFTDFSSATRVYGIYNCRLFRGSTNNYVLSYYGSSSQVYTTITN